METTFGLPRYVFPPTAEVLAAIIRFCRQTLEDGEVPVLFGYSLGKSQEILSSLAEAALPVMLHPQTLKMTRIYEELGQTFPTYRPFTLTEVAGHVVSVPRRRTSRPGSARLSRAAPRRSLAGRTIPPRFTATSATPRSRSATMPTTPTCCALSSWCSRSASSPCTGMWRNSPAPCASAALRRGRWGSITSWRFPWRSCIGSHF